MHVSTIRIRYGDTKAGPCPGEPQTGFRIQLPTAGGIADETVTDAIADAPSVLSLGWYW